MANGGDGDPRRDRAQDRARQIRAEILRRSQARGGFSPSDFLSTGEIAGGRFAQGVVGELTLDRPEIQEALGIEGGTIDSPLNIERTERREGEGTAQFVGRVIANADQGDVAEVMGRIVGAIPAAVVTGGIARGAARALTMRSLQGARSAASVARNARRAAEGIDDVSRATRLTREAQRATRRADNLKRIAQFTGAVSRAPPETASAAMRLASAGRRNVFEGLAFSLSTAPVRELHEGQSRAQQIAAETGIGAAADFLFGVALGRGARPSRMFQEMASSDNHLDRLVAAEGVRMIRPPDEPAGLIGPGPRRLEPGPPEFRRARFRGQEGRAGQEGAGALATPEGELDEAFPTIPGQEAAVLDTEAPVRGLIPSETGGPRIARGEIADPRRVERAGDVREGPFLSRPVTREAEILSIEEPPARPEGPPPELEARRVEDPEPAARGLEAEPEAEPAGRGLEAEDAFDEAISGIRSRNAQSIARDVAAARTEAEVFTAASDLRSLDLSRDDAAIVQDLLQRKLAQVRGRPRPSAAPAGRAPAGAEAEPAGPMRGAELSPQERIRRLEEQLSRAMTRATEAEEAARRDPLTGLENKAAGEEATERAIQSRAPGEEIVRLRGDADNFKAVNDVLGTDEGDELLRRIGRIFDEEFREQDAVTISRAGGDEFTATIKVAEGQDPTPIARRVEESVNRAIEESGVNQRLQAEGFDDQVAFSTAAIKAQGDQPISELDAAADRAVKARKQERGVSGGIEGRRAREEALEANAAETLRARTESPQETPVGPPGATRDVGRSMTPDGEPPLPEPQATPSIGRKTPDAAGPPPERSVDARTAAQEQPTGPAGTRQVAEPLSGPEGAQTGVVAADGTRLEARYRVVPVEEIQQSHDALSFQPNERFPEAAQNRDYLNDPNAQEHVIEGSMNPDMDQHFDPTVRATGGPPVAVEDGVLLNGNGRIMMLKRMRSENPEAWARYQQELRDRADRFGLSEVDVASVEDGILVRVVPSDELDPSDVTRLAEVNRKLDMEFGKRRSPEREAFFRSERLREKPQSVEYMVDNLEADETIRAFLGTSRGRGFFDRLVSSGVVDRSEASLFMDPQGRFTEQGKTLVEQMIRMAAIGDPDIVRAAPASWKQRIDKAIPAIIRANSAGDYSVQNVLQEAMTIGARIDQNPNITGSNRVQTFFQQTDLFGGEGFSPEAIQLARVIEDGTQNGVSKAFRAYAKRADAAGGSGPASFLDDTPTPKQLFEEVFGKAEFAEDGSLTGGLGRAVEKDRFLASLRSQLSKGGEDAPGLRERLQEVIPEDLRASASKASDEELVSFMDDRGMFTERTMRFIRNPGEPNPNTVPNRPPIDTSNPEAGFFAPHVFWEGAKSIWRRWFTTAGDLPREAYRMKIRRDGRLKSIGFQIQRTHRRFRTAVKEAFGSTNLDENQARMLDRALKGEIEMESIPAPLRPVLRDMRRQIDNFSDRAIEIGAVEGDMAIKFAENTGVYANRSYRIFTDPKWSRKVPDDVRNRAKAFIRQERPDLDDDGVEALIEALLYRGEESPIRVMIRENLVGRKELSILRQRKDIPAPIRALWGEFEDPMVNYANSVSKLAALTENHQFLTEMLEAGKGTYFFDQPTKVGDTFFKAKVNPRDDPAFTPFSSGIYTTPEIQTALREVSGSLSPQHGALFRAYMKANALTKFSKTVGSLQTHVRNTVANVGFAVANGHWRVREAGQALRTTVASFTKDESSFADFFQKLQALGVVDDTARAGDLRTVLEASVEGGLEDIAGSDVDRLFKSAGKIAAEVYRAEDDVFKVYGFLNERARYGKAFPDMPDDELDEFVARIVRDTYPTYSNVPRAIRELSKFPVVGVFPSFTAEVFRVGKNQLELIGRELADPATRGIGMERAVGLTLAIAAPAGAAFASRYVNNVSKEQDDDIRQFLPPWSKNSNLIYVGKNEDEGTWRVVDMSYTDPYSYLKDPLNALLRGENWQQSLLESAWEVSQPFLSEEILFQALREARQNETATGGRIYNEQDPLHVKWAKGTGHIMEAVEPGTFEQVERIGRGVLDIPTAYGREYDPKVEAAAVFLGHRVTEVDPKVAFPFRAREYSNDRREATNVLSSVAGRPGPVSDEEIEQAWTHMEAARRRQFEQVQRSIRAASRMGLQDNEIAQMLRGAGLSKEDAFEALRGDYDPFMPTSRYLQSRAQRNPDMRAEFSRRRRLISRLSREARRGGQP